MEVGVGNMERTTEQDKWVLQRERKTWERERSQLQRAWKMDKDRWDRGKELLETTHNALTQSWNRERKSWIWLSKTLRQGRDDLIDELGMI